MKYDFLLFDADNTLLDFSAAEKSAFFQTAALFGVACDDDIYRLYSEINDGVWKEYERGDILREQIFSRRFDIFKNQTGAKFDSAEYNDCYVHSLANYGPLMPFAKETLEYFQSKNKQLFLVTNGIEFIQESRLSIAGIKHFFKKRFISEVIGFQKPSKEYFDFVESNIDNFKKENAVVIGDSLTADVAAGKFGFDTVWCNFKNKPNNTDNKPDYEIHSLPELYNIIE